MEFLVFGSEEITPRLHEMSDIFQSSCIGDGICLGNILTNYNPLKEQQTPAMAQESLELLDQINGIIKHGHELHLIHILYTRHCFVLSIILISIFSYAINSLAITSDSLYIAQIKTIIHHLSF